MTAVSLVAVLKPRAVAAALALVLSSAGLAATSLAPTGEDARAKLQFFEQEIRPLLAQHCFECHGDKKQKGGLRLDHASDILVGGHTGPALVPGKPDDSLLIQAVRRTEEDFAMPPDDPLPAEAVAKLEQWIAMGAPWPEGVATRAKAETDAHGFTAEQRRHWVFQPLSDPRPPEVTGAATGWVAGEIDRFVAAKHAEFGLSPSPAASREELARRLTFDLHGLPPTQEQLAALVADASPHAYERFVDELLASPRYGERWAQHWLDLVRYGESDGYRADHVRRHAWPYRDYVIRSLNADKPYDQFVREQLAGDELAPGQPEVLIATSYLRNPVYEWNQRDVRGQAELILNDITDNAGEVFLGLSMGCARCHDHKFDPILQQDYYALRAFFQPVVWRSDLWLATAEEQAAHARQQADWETATAAIRAEMDALAAPALERNVKRAHDRFTADLQAMMSKPAAKRAPEEHVLATLAERQLLAERERFDPIKALKSEAEKARYRELDAKLKAFDSLKPKPLLPAFVATDAGPKAPPTMLKTRQGERAVAPAFLTLLGAETPAIELRTHSTGRRTALAAWITRPENPLSTRAIVNRVWHYHFGRGLAGTPNDLGHLGERPTHPELLDWLARRFVAGGWSLKRLHREILLSATYRQTARAAVSERAALVDPANKYLWRFPPRRLDAEQARDAMLAASGELDVKGGGPPQDAALSSRRSVYTLKKRNNQNELLRSLDAPAGFTSIADRQSTATPLQALLFLNGDWTLARARKLAQRETSSAGIWRAVLGREPSPEEQREAEEFVARRIAATPASAMAEPTATDSGPPGPDTFREESPQERLLVRGAPKEGDEFTAEAIVTLASADAGPAYRTIVSRWTGEQNSLESHGWSLGVAGAKSAFGSRALVLQLVGEDDNMNTAYEAVDSGLRLEPGVPYHVAADVSCAERRVVFHVRPLRDPIAPWQTARVRHAIIGKLGDGQAAPVIGGLHRRGPHQFDGRIAAARVSFGAVAAEALSSDPAAWSGGAFVWRAGESESRRFEWSGGLGTGDSPDPQVRARADLAHVLLNSNEFLYLH